METSKNTKLIFAPDIARRLLKGGCTIVDIKANKENPNKTVFVFKNDEHFQETLGTVLKERSEKREPLKTN